MANEFDGINEKLKRTDENIQNLNVEVCAFFQGCKYPVLPKLQDKRHAEAIQYHKTLPIPLRFSVLAGEIIHHLRSCLDHLVWEFSSEASRRSKDSRFIEFPILEERPTPENEVTRYKRKIQGITNTRILDLIEQFQPYHGLNPEINPLAVIQRMDIHDKHRELAFAYPTGSMDNLPYHLVMEVRRRLSGIGGALTEDLKREIDQYGQVTPHISFRDFSGGVIQPIVPQLTQLTNHVRYVVETFEGEFRRQERSSHSV